MLQHTLKIQRIFPPIHLLNEREDKIQSRRDLHYTLAHPSLSDILSSRRYYYSYNYFDYSNFIK